jgi:hypothetical protein
VVCQKPCSSAGPRSRSVLAFSGRGLDNETQEVRVRAIRGLIIGCGVCGLFGSVARIAIWAAEPPAINPFAPPSSGQTNGSAAGEAQDADALPGGVELSSGRVLPGLVSLTRDARLRIYDDKVERQREIPLRAVREIACKVKREWMERQWRFKESANNEKVYTGRSYPVREYLHTLTLTDGRKITGPLAAIVYVRPLRDDSPGGGSLREKAPAIEQFVLHKRDKGDLGQELDSLVYVKRIRLGRDAFEEAKAKQKEKTNGETTAEAPRGRAASPKQKERNDSQHSP